MDFVSLREKVFYCWKLSNYRYASGAMKERRCGNFFSKHLMFKNKSSIIYLYKTKEMEYLIKFIFLFYVTLPAETIF